MWPPEKPGTREGAVRQANGEHEAQTSRSIGQFDPFVSSLLWGSTPRTLGEQALQSSPGDLREDDRLGEDGRGAAK